MWDYKRRDKNKGGWGTRMDEEEDEGEWLGRTRDSNDARQSYCQWAQWLELWVDIIDFTWFYACNPESDYNQSNSNYFLLWCTDRWMVSYVWLTMALQIIMVVLVRTLQSPSPLKLAIIQPLLATQRYTWWGYDTFFECEMTIFLRLLTVALL